MLTSEQPQEHLKVFQDPKAQLATLVRVVTLPSNLSAIGQVLLQDGSVWTAVANNRDKFLKLQHDTLIQLGELKAGDRRKLFEALFPKAAFQVEATWKLFDRLPYQTTYYRRPFRLPHHYSPKARVAWVQRLVIVTKKFPNQEVAWYATWAPYLGYSAPDSLGYLFAGAIDAGGDIGKEVYDILITSANGSHEIGRMGRHVVRGLLCSSRLEGWDFVERMLLAAQREEGLRQVILESIDEAQPQAFRRMLQLILEHNLSRFSAAIRAFSVWFGLPFEVVSQKTVNEVLVKVIHYLDSRSECEKVVQQGSPEEAYYALWSMAFEDAAAALPHAVALRQSAEVERRFAATHLLAQLTLTGSLDELLKAVLDDDLRIATRAFTGLAQPDYAPALLGQSDLFERLEQLLTRVKHEKSSLKPLVWDWLPVVLERKSIASRLIECLGSRSPLRLVPYLSIMEPGSRNRVAHLIDKLGDKNSEGRQVLLTLAADPSPRVRETALSTLQRYKLAESESSQIEALLARKSQDLRRGAIRLLLGLPDKSLMQSIHRLIAQKDENQRLAGLELLQECKRVNRCRPDYHKLAVEFREQSNLTDAETRMLENILAENVEEYTLENALGLMDPDKRTKAVPPHWDKAHTKALNKVKLGSPAALACLKSLEALIQQHRNDPVEIDWGLAKKIELLGNVRNGFPRPDPTVPCEQDLARLPSRETWESWWQSRPESFKDTDGFELIRALAILNLADIRWGAGSRVTAEISPELQKVYGIRLDFSMEHVFITQTILEWILRSHPVPGETDFILDALEASIGKINSQEVSVLKEVYHQQERVLSSKKLSYLHVAHWQRAFWPETWMKIHHTRLWNLVRWVDEPKPGVPRYFLIYDHSLISIRNDIPLIKDTLLAFEAGAATRDDLIDLFFRHTHQQAFRGNFPLLREFSGRRSHRMEEQFPILRELMETCRERILSIETKRGDLPTAASAPSLCLRSVPGLKNLFWLLVALGKSDFERGWLGGQSRTAVLSHLIRNSYPIEADTTEEFARRAADDHIADKRLIELAVYAPQWATFVEERLQWPKFTEAVRWIYAHTKDRQWMVEKDIRDEWAVRTSEYTSLTAERLMDGAVDVAWFHRVYTALGEERWQMVYQAAEYAAGGSGHVRARLFADAMLGKVSSQTLAERIKAKRHQDSVRALGLIPLPDMTDLKQEILRRYEVMQDFLRTSKKFGSMRRASERLAVEIGMENLARTAGYPDPQRLEWAMEIEAISDLAGGPVVVESGGVELSLSVNDLGEPELFIVKNGKPLKSIPATVKKDERVAGLVSRKQQLDRQVSRMRLSLEQAMCNRDVFRGPELQALFRHPMLMPMLEQLVFVGVGGMGYPTDGGKTLTHHTGKVFQIGPEDEVLIAHPLDLLKSEDWHAWQHECFIAERIQPFKQIFRELYVLTKAEKAEGNLSRRYAGHQVNPRQAVGLFGSRGWVVNQEEGVQKTFHTLGISARVGFLQGMFTPAEVENLTIEAVAFTERGSWTLLPLGKIPERIFSEVMRDLDLVVSVAHAGGIDPEASASSIEARSALIRETCALMKLTNVQLADHFILIDGKLGNYNVHLGSGVVHKQPGEALCIIPVHSQHRGRLFLPFVDDDPKTAEIVSKVLLLAQDDQIKDPTIIEQIL